MRRVSALRLMAALAGALTASACEPSVTTPQEASQRVRDSYAWMADAELCPIDVMRSGMRVNGLKAMSCAEAELPMCFRRCRHGDTDSCYWLANTLEHVDPEDGAAQALYQRACTLGEPSGCTNRAAQMYVAKRRDAGVLKCAARTFERTCQLRDAWGCSMYGYALHDGRGVAHDDARALEALAAACRTPDASSPACGAAQTLTAVIRQSQAAASTGAGGP